MQKNRITTEKAFALFQNGLITNGEETPVEVALPEFITKRTVVAALIRLGTTKDFKEVERQAQALLKKSGFLPNKMCNTKVLMTLEENIKKLPNLGNILEATTKKNNQSFEEFLYYAEFEYLPKQEARLQNLVNAFLDPNRYFAEDNDLY